MACGDVEHELSFGSWAIYQARELYCVVKLMIVIEKIGVSIESTCKL